MTAEQIKKLTNPFTNRVSQPHPMFDVGRRRGEKLLPPSVNYLRSPEYRDGYAEGLETARKKRDAIVVGVKSF